MIRNIIKHDILFSAKIHFILKIYCADLKKKPIKNDSPLNKEMQATQYRLYHEYRFSNNNNNQRHSRAKTPDKKKKKRSEEGHLRYGEKLNNHRTCTKWHNQSHQLAFTTW